MRPLQCYLLGRQIWFPRVPGVQVVSEICGTDEALATKLTVSCPALLETPTVKSVKKGTCNQNPY